jgi:dipeptidyl aminopeptidase/acylaminoacyl peptidase
LTGGAGVRAGADLVPPGARPEKVAGGCKFTEGPAADAEGNLFFTDAPNHRIMVLRPGGKLEVWNDDSRDANGLRFDARGRLVACCGEDGARAVVRWEKDGSRTVLADRYNGKRLTAPNDLCFDRRGRVYFTDPCYGRRPDDGQERFAVYRVEAADSEPVPNRVTRVVDDVDTPNGIMISPDNKTLYVADSAARKDGPHLLVAYDVLPDGTCKRRAVLHDFQDGRGIDGMVLDTAGNIYATAGTGERTGVYVFSPAGEQLGFIRAPETATNCTFGDKDLRTLYITAGTSVYRVRLNAVGLLPYPPAPPGAPPEEGPRDVLSDFARVKDVRAALLSPDGRQIAYTVAVTDLANNRVRTEVWLIPAGGGDPRRLPLETDAVETTLWSSDSSRLAVLGKAVEHKDGQEEETWLWVVDADTGKGNRLVRPRRSNHYLAHQGTALCWSPDGASLAYVAADAGVAPPAGGPIVVDRLQYKTRTALSDNWPTHIWTVEVASGKTRQLTTGRYDEHSIDWSPGGEEIVFCSNRGPDPDANLNYDLYTVRVADGTVRPLARTPGTETSPVWSPDGRSIAYTMTKRALSTIDSVAEDTHVWVLDRESGRARELAATLDRRCVHVRWAPDGRAVYCLARDRGRSLVYRIPLAGGEATPVFSLPGNVTDFSLPAGAAGSPLRMVCALSTPTGPPEVWTCNGDGSDRAVRTRLNAGATDGWALAEPQEVSFASFDDTPVQGWLMVPPGATADHKVPLLLMIHGGPHGMYGLGFSATFQLLCRRGYAVLYLNPRGSTGYGQRFSDGCVGDWGGGDYKDLMAGLDHVLARHPEIDAGRLGVSGGSYGGYMTEWVITQTGRFKAAVSYAGLSDLISFYATSLYQDLIHVEFGGAPWDHYDLLWERSPLRHVKRVSTPTLLLHGEADNDVPITQSEELYTALRRRGVETLFVRYPGQGHGATEPRHQLDQLERTVAWFDRWLQSDRPLVVELWRGRVPDETGTIGPETVRMSPKLTRKEVEVTEPTKLVTNVTKPTLTIYRPARDKDTGTAVLICPGGGYWNLYWELEGEEVAAWLNAQGITGIILKYRVPRRPDEPKGEPARRPLQDAQRAVSLVRSKAREWGIDPQRIGMVGFSAGGHLAIATATGFEKRTYEPSDDIDQVSCRPDFAIAVYPGYLKAKDKDELVLDLRVPAGTPPIFLAHGGADIISPPEHSVLMYLALRRAGIPAELHVYAGAAHDFGVRKVDHPCSTWTDRCVDWLRSQGLLKITRRD